MVLALLTYANNREEQTKELLIMLGNNLLFPFPIVALYYGLATENSWLRRVLGSRAFVLLGRSSYVFYLIHDPVIHYLGKPYLGGRFYNLYVVIMLVIVILVSVGIYLFYEAPLNKLLHQPRQAANFNGV